MESIQQAQPADAAAVLELIKARIRWMDEQGIRQWNTTGYLEAYGLDYFMQAARQGVLYVLRPPQGPIQGAVILLEEDPRWPDGAPACYVHNVVTACGVPGAGVGAYQQQRGLCARKPGRARHCARGHCDGGHGARL